jgi:hypothetical protein
MPVYQDGLGTIREEGANATVPFGLKISFRVK